MVKHPIADTNLSFTEYVNQCRTLIQKNRTDLAKSNPNAKVILDANAPFELYPKNPIHKGNKLRYGVLLIHGLLDCPFSLKEIGLVLQNKGVLSRAVLLPGHGTTPKDLLNTSYEEWIQMVRFGVQSLRHEVEEIYLIGYSTGAALALHQALNDPQIKGIIGLAPAIKIKAPVDIVVGWHKFLSHFGWDKTWVYKEQEIDYAKYRSISFNAVKQVAKLTALVAHSFRKNSLQCPIFMVMSLEDETISCRSAIKLFSKFPHPESQVLLYTPNQFYCHDARITTRTSYYPELHINNFAHVALPFSPNNSHYGQRGDYPYASHFSQKDVLLGAYNRLEVDAFERLYRLGLVKNKRQELTSNPDFNYTTEKIINFILRNESRRS